MCLALLGGLGWGYYRVIIPLRRLSKQAEALTEGHLEALERPCGGIEAIDTLRRSMSGMVGHVRRAQEEHHAYTHALTHAQEAERARIARELHDDTIQSLIAVAQRIDMSHHWLDSAPEQASTTLQTTRQQVVEVINGLRNLIADLRPPALAELGLIPALQMQADKVPGLAVKIVAQGTAHRLGEAQDLTLFRCAQEALNNARAHGQATTATITVDYECHDLTMRIQDNGRGFVAPEHLRDLAARGHYGLLGIQERAESLNGSLTIDSAPGRGATLTIRIPQNCAVQPDHTVQDPVCSAYIEPQQAYGSVEYGGHQYFFCCPVCQGAFQKNPTMYLQTGNGAPSLATMLQ